MIQFPIQARTLCLLVAAVAVTQGLCAPANAQVVEFRPVHGLGGGFSRSIEFSPDGATFAYLTTSELLFVYDSLSGDRLYSLRVDDDARAIAYSRDSQYLATTRAGETSVWDLATGRERVVIPNGYNAVAFSPDGTNLIVDSVGPSNVQEATVWDLDTVKPLGKISRSGSGGVWALAYLPDGSGIISGSNDGVLTLWDPLTFQPIRTYFPSHPNRVDCVQVSADGTRVASLNRGSSGKVIVRSVGTQSGVLLNLDIPVEDIAFASDGLRIATISPSYGIRVYDVATGQVVRNYDSDQQEYRGAWETDGDSIVYGIGYGLGRWNLLPTEEFALGAPGAAPTVLRLSPDGSRLAVVRGGDDIEVFDAATRTFQFTLSGHSGIVRAVEFSPDGTKLLSGGDDNLALVWDLEQPAPVVLHTVNQIAPVRFVNFSSDGSLFLASIGNRTVVADVVNGAQTLLITNGSSNSLDWGIDTPARRIVNFAKSFAGSSPLSILAFDLDTGSFQGSSTVSSTFPADVQGRISPDGAQVMFPWNGSQNNAVLHVSNTTNLSPHTAFGKSLSGRVTAITWGTPGKEAVYAKEDGGLTMFDLTTGRDIRRATLRTDASLVLLDANDDVSTVVYSYSDGSIVLANTSDWHVVQSETWLLSEQRSMAVSPDSNSVLIGDSEGVGRGRAIRWDIQSGRVLNEYLPSIPNGVPVKDVTYSPDGGRVALATTDQRVHVFDTFSAAKLLVLQGHTGEVNSVRYSPDGSQLLTSSEDRTARLWDAQTGAPIRSFNLHTLPVNIAEFSPDGASVITGGDDSFVVSWDKEAGNVHFANHTNNGVVWDVAVSSDGSVIAAATSGALQQPVIFYDATTGAVIDVINRTDPELDIIVGSVESLAVSDVVDMFGLGARGYAGIWDSAKRLAIRSFEHVGSSSTLRRIAFADDGEMAFTLSDRQISVWDGSRDIQLRKYTGDHFASHVEESPDGLLLAIGRNTGNPASEGALEIWNKEAESRTLELPIGAQSVSGICFSPDGNVVAGSISGSTRAELKWWRVQDGTPLGTVGVPRTIGNFVSAGQAIFLSDGLHLAFATFESYFEPFIGRWYRPAVHVVNIQTGTVEFVLEGHSSVGSVNAIDLSPNGSRLALTAGRTAFNSGSTTYDPNIYIWDLQSRSVVDTIDARLGISGAVGSGKALFTPSGNELVLAVGTGNSTDAGTYVVDLATHDVVASFRGNNDFDVSPDGSRILVVSGSSGRTTVYDINSRARLQMFDHPLGTSQRAQFSRDGADVYLTGSKTVVSFADRFPRFAVNHPPVLSPVGDKEVGFDETLQFTMSATDPDDGQTVTYSAVNLPAGATLDSLTGAFSWTPTPAAFGRHAPVVLRATDDGNPPLSDIESIAITVGSANRPPVLAPIGVKQIAGGSLLEFQISATDPDPGDQLHYSAANLPPGAFFDGATRTLRWSPAFGESAVYEDVLFRVSDSGVPSLSDFERVTFIVGNAGGGGGGANSPPVLTPIGDQHGSVNQLLAFAISGSDPDGNPVTYSATGLPVGATFNSITRIFSWTPTASAAGTVERVQFAIADNGNPVLTDSEIVAISVSEGSNRPPVLQPIGDFEVAPGEIVEFAVTATDPDFGQALRFTSEGLPNGATLDAETGAFSWFVQPEQDGEFFDVLLRVTDNGTPALSDTLSLIFIVGEGLLSEALMRDAILGRRTFAPDQLDRMDTNRDGALDIADVLYLGVGSAFADFADPDVPLDFALALIDKRIDEVVERDGYDAAIEQLRRAEERLSRDPVIYARYEQRMREASGRLLGSPPAPDTDALARTRSESAEDCREKTTVIFVNGVNTTLAGVGESALLIERALESARFEKNVISVRPVWNMSATDVIHSEFGRTCVLEYPKEQCEAAGFLMDLGEALDQIAITPTEWGLAGGALNGTPNADIQRDMDGLRNAIIQEFESGRNVVVVAHSQGNLFVEAVLPQLTAEQLNSVRFVSVASPILSVVPSNIRSHFIFDRDILQRFVQPHPGAIAYGGTPTSWGITEHLFNTSYMEYARVPILNKIVEYHSALKNPHKGRIALDIDCGAGCTPQIALTNSHRFESFTLTNADSATLNWRAVSVGGLAVLPNAGPLEPGNSVEIAVGFNPATNPPPFTGQILITNDCDVNDSRTIQVAVSNAGTLGLSTNSIEFGGTITERTVRVTNIGAGPLNYTAESSVSAVEINGGPVYSNTLAPGAFEDVTITADGCDDLLAALTFTNDGEPLNTELLQVRVSSAPLLRVTLETKTCPFLNVDMDLELQEPGGPLVREVAPVGLFGDLVRTSSGQQACGDPDFAEVYEIPCDSFLADGVYSINVVNATAHAVNPCSGYFTLRIANNDHEIFDLPGVVLACNTRYRDIVRVEVQDETVTSVAIGDWETEVLP